MAKIFIACAALLAAVVAEPPVSSYLPPGRNGQQPSGQYGAPDASGFNGGFGSRALSKSYGPPSNALDVYSGRNGQAPSSRYGPPANSFGNGNGNGNGNGHSFGNGNGNGHSFGNGNGNGYHQPSASYGVPEQGRNDFDFDSVTVEAASRFGSFNGQPSSSYSAPSARFGGQPSQSYGAPARSNGGAAPRFGQPSSTYGAPSRSAQSSFGAAGRSAQPSSTYGAPSFQASGRGFGGSNSFNGNNGAGRYTAAISSSYTAPSNGFGASNGFGRSSAPSTSYGAPSNGFNGGFGRSSQSSFSAPSSTYGAPSNHLDNGYARQPSSEYGAPGYARKATTEDPLAEPANYQYNYEVRDEEQVSGAEFGHQESREDESARGVYHVLLPDGRMQIVEYEADEEGYRPNIRYEETGGYPDARSGQGNNNNNNHNGGY